MTAYSIYLQLPSTRGGYILYLQMSDMPCYGDRDPRNPCSEYIAIKYPVDQPLKFKLHPDEKCCFNG